MSGGPQDRLDPSDFGPLVARHVPRQRWYAGSSAPGSLRVIDSQRLREPWPCLEWLLVEADGAVYQLLLGGRPLGQPGQFLQGHEEGVLGNVGDAFWYDATLDPELSLAVLGLVTQGAEDAEHVRPVGAEQSNSSFVYDDRLIAKIFRRLHRGPNPDVEITTALSESGFTHVPEAVATWSRDGYDLAFVQRFLAGGSEGWALALTSLRDLYAGDGAVPGQAGGDFAAEALRVGQVTAEMHLALAGAFGTAPGDSASWADSMEESLDILEQDDRDGAHQVVERLRTVEDPGPATRVHGDYHLGQVMRTDTGWYVLDFEGEPARPLEQRRTPTSPMKDVTGMLRSLDYASRAALAERHTGEAEHLEPRAEAWCDRNRQAFLAGYLNTEGAVDLVPSNPLSYQALMDAFELDKAVYELGYERAYRPEWVEIPHAAIRRLVAG